MDWLSSSTGMVVRGGVCFPLHETSINTPAVKSVQYNKVRFTMTDQLKLFPNALESHRKPVARRGRADVDLEGVGGAVDAVQGGEARGTELDG